MTRLAIIGLLGLGALGCGKSSDEPPKVDVGADHVAAVNAAIPAELKGKVEFELGTVKEDRGRSSKSFKLAIPKGWKKSFMGELVPPDADNFGSKTMGRTSIGVSSNCDGTCEKKDWAAVSDKVNFAQFTGGKIEGKLVKDEKGENRRTLVFESKPSEVFPEKDVAFHIVTAWWDPSGTKYFTCTADVGQPVKGLAAAFEKACAKVSGD
jgi:hypothetical protein